MIVQEPNPTPGTIMGDQLGDTAPHVSMYTFHP